MSSGAAQQTVADFIASLRAEAYNGILDAIGADAHHARPGSQEREIVSVVQLVATQPAGRTDEVHRAGCHETMIHE